MGIFCFFFAINEINNKMSFLDEQFEFFLCVGFHRICDTDCNALQAYEEFGLRFT